LSSQAISLLLNGKQHSVASETPLPRLLEDLGVDRRLVAVAHNGDVIPRDQYESVVLHDGDRVEIVRMVGGG
jgi:thiamine biosynthesis protein ThiS